MQKGDTRFYVCIHNFFIYEGICSYTAYLRETSLNLCYVLHLCMMRFEGCYRFSSATYATKKDAAPLKKQTHHLCRKNTHMPVKSASISGTIVLLYCIYIQNQIPCVPKEGLYLTFSNTARAYLHTLKRRRIY